MARLGLGLALGGSRARRSGGGPVVPGWVLTGADYDLDLVGNRAYGATSVADALTCTRALAGFARESAGTLATFAENVLRRTDLGLLVEESRTNMLVQSQTFETSWSSSAGSVSVDQLAAPDGTITADLFNENSATNTHGLTQANIVTVRNTTYTISGYIKYAGRRWVRVSPGGGLVGHAWFDVQNGVVGASSLSVGTLLGVTMSPLANGWYRVSLTGTTVNTTTGELVTVRFFSAAADNDSASHVGLNGPAFYIWGVQMTLGNYRTSYIPTVASAVARPADVVVGSLSAPSVVSAAFFGVVPDYAGVLATLGQFDDGSDDNRVAVYRDTDNSLKVRVASGGVDQAVLNLGAVSVGDEVNVALRAGTNDFAATLNGGSVVTDTSGDMPSGMNVLRMGSAVGGGAWNNFATRHARKAALLSNAELQAWAA